MSDEPQKQPKSPVVQSTGKGMHSPALPRAGLDDWRLDEELRHLGRLLRKDDPGPEPNKEHREPDKRSKVVPSAPVSTTAGGSWTHLRTAAAWLLICAGLAATVCGLMLLAWYLFAERSDLLIPGLAAAAAGQFALLGGFLIQPAAPSSSPASDAAHPKAQWLEVHRRIDEVLRADLPNRREPE